MTLVGVLIWTLGVLLSASSSAQTPSRLEEFLAQVHAGDVVPGADRFGAIRGTPPVAPAIKGDKDKDDGDEDDDEEIVGYVYLTSDVVDTAGYSGKPIHTLVGLDPEGTIVGAKLLEHHEPIVLVGIPESRIEHSLEGLIGFNPLKAAAKNEQSPEVDIVSGATVTVLVIEDSVLRSAGRIAQQLVGRPSASDRPARAVDMEAGEATDWSTLLGNGAVRRLQLSVGDVNEAFVRSGDARAVARPEKGPPDATFIDLYVALVSQPAIGRSLLGEAGFKRLQSRLRPKQSALLVMGAGPYSFKGSGYVRGGVFDRVQVTQGTETIRFRDKDHERIDRLAADGAPRFKEIALFALPDGTQFQPADPWTLHLLVQRRIGALDKAFTTFGLNYRLPQSYTKPIPSAEPIASAATAERAAVHPAKQRAGRPLASEPGEPLWERIWRSKIASITVLVVMLLALTAIFFFQDILVKHEKLFDYIRLSYLAVTLIWLGWVAQAQLSVVNVLFFMDSLRGDFDWSHFLIDPLIFILWFSVAAALLFWGRGPFCGWLCPFGALQELTNRAARLLRVPQIKVPWGVHERLWPIKYVIFLVLFGISLGSLALSERLAEVEPFKTAIILRFMRDWWFVLFAVALIGMGLFIERFFCRYLCPLGAALAIPGRLRMFDWLKRYRECGNPCMRCYNECPVGAIHPEGHINPNECISCLHCQVLYHHERKCPVLIQRRLKRERRAALSPGTFGTSSQKAKPAPAAPKAARVLSEGVEQ
ncbi:MAG: regulatory protein NosR [Hyphomicrobiaceae bacterium]|nr:regulatory protein NosR [Hyphomicrobiaceae bacterium]